MKDEHDNQTGELLPFPAPGGGGGQRSGHTAAAGTGKLSARELRMMKLEIDRGYRVREGLETYLPVAMVAKEWQVTPRRVRALLFEGRLKGRQLENGYWEVAYPYTITEGTRGPLMCRSRPKNPELRLV